MTSGVASRASKHLRFSQLILLGATATFFPGCVSDYYFAPLPSCSSVLQETKGNLRILFMVDNSGSTKTTDPNHQYRAQTIQTFLSQFGSKTNFSYSFGYFSGTSSTAWDTSGARFTGSPSAPFGAASDLSAALSKYVTITPGGNTPYNAAFGELQNIVMGDIGANGGTYAYAVVFMSDGMPTDVPAPVESNLAGLVDHLKQAVPGNALTVSTVYFGPESSSQSIANLQTMASEGNGQFVDTNAVGNLAISDIITVPGHACAGPTGAASGG